MRQYTINTGLPRQFRGKESACNAGTTGATGSIPGWGRSTGGGHGNSLQYSCLENPTDRGAWQATDSPQGHKELDTMKRPSTYAQSILGCGFRIQTHNFFLHELKQMPVYLNTCCCNLTSIYYTSPLLSLSSIL